MKNMLAKRLLILAHSDIHANEAVETRLGVADTELLPNNNKTPAFIAQQGHQTAQKNVDTNARVVPDSTD